MFLRISLLFCLSIACFVGMAHTASARTSLPCSFASPGACQANHRPIRAANAIDFVEAKLLHVRIGFWGGFIKQGSTKRAMNLFNGGALRDLFFDDRHATKYFDSYRAFSVAGVIVMSLGLVGILSSAFVPLFTNTSSSAFLDVMLPIMLGSLGIEIIGLVLVAIGNSRLMKAIDIYNQGVFYRARRGKLRISVAPLPKGGLVAVAGVQF